MPTLRVVTVKPSGGDYSSLAAAEAGEQGDLVSLDRQLDIQCYAMTDTAQVVFDGWTTDATRYIRVYAPVGERHGGKWDDTKYVLDVTSSMPASFFGLDVRAHYTRLEFLQVGGAPSGINGRSIVSLNGTDNCRLTNCIIRAVPSGGSTDTGGVGNSTGTLAPGNLIANNVIYLVGSSSGSIGIGNSTGSFTPGYYLYGNTVVGWETGITRFAGVSITAKNNLCSGNTTDYASTYTGDSVSNLSADASSPNSGLRNKTVVFADAAGYDFHLSASDTAARGNGTDLSADAVYPVADDIDGDTRAAPWDIGADQFSGGIPPPPAGGLLLLRRRLAA